MSVRWPFVGRVGELELVGAAMATQAGVVLVGAAGVGKTRLAYEVVTSADPARYLGLWAAATSATRSIPLGALARLLSSSTSDTASPVDVLKRVGDALITRAGGRRLVLGIDDAHLLDDLSAALVLQLAQTGRVCVLVTVRTGETVPDPITALWKEELAARLEIETMPRVEVHRVLAAALDGQLEGATSRRLWDATLGNMLLLRELVNAGLDSGALAEVAGVWRWDGPWVVSPSLVELITGRVGRLDPVEQDVLEIVAYGEPIGASVLIGLTEQRAVLGLESENLLWVRQDGRRVDVRLGHPLYGEVLRANASPLRARIIRQRLADAVEATGARRRDDWLRIATWRLDAAAPVSPAVLAAAARQAFAALDLGLAERLARGAFDAGEDLAAGEVLWRVLFLGGRATEAEEALTRLLDLPMSDPQRAELAFGRAYNLFWGLRRIEEAYAVLRETRPAIRDPVWLAEIDLLECVFELLQGRARQAVEGVARIPLSAGASVRITAQTMLVRGMAFAHLGRLADARAVLQEAAGPSAGCPEIPWVAESRRLYRCYSELFAGNLSEAGELAESFYTHAVGTNWAFALGLSCGARAQVARLGPDRGAVGAGGAAEPMGAADPDLPQLPARRDRARRGADRQRQRCGGGAGRGRPAADTRRRAAATLDRAGAVVGRRGRGDPERGTELACAAATYARNPEGAWVRSVRAARCGLAGCSGRCCGPTGGAGLGERGRVGGRTRRARGRDTGRRRGSARGSRAAARPVGR